MLNPVNDNTTFDERHRNRQVDVIFLALSHVNCPAKDMDYFHSKMNLSTFAVCTLEYPYYLSYFHSAAV
jgi:hypothetical protein